MDYSTEKNSSAKIIDHVVHVFPSPSWGGAEIYAVELAHRQTLEGLRVSIWVLPGSPMHKRALALNLAIITDPCPWRMNILATPGLARTLRKYDVSILHLHWAKGVWAFAFVRAIFPVKQILHQHLWINHGKRDPLHWWLYRGVHRIIVAGTKAKSALLQNWPVAEGQVRVCPYAVELSYDRSDLSLEQRREARMRLGISNGSVVFGMFARLDPQKGTIEFLKALSEITPHYPEAFGLVVGDPTLGEASAKNYLEEVETLLNGPTLRNNSLRLGFQTDFKELLRFCDVLVVPSYHESYSLMILHAFAVGVPVLATNSGGTTDLVSGELGWLVPPRDVEALRSALGEILAHPKIRTDKAARVRGFVEKTHSFETILAQWRDIYKDL